MPLKIIILILIFPTIAACYNIKNDSPEEKELTVKDLSSHPIEFPKTESISPKRLNAIKYYQSYLQKTEFKTHYAEALRRVADLELEISEEQKNEASDERSREAIMLSSIEHYKTYLRTYAGHEKNDLIYYQLAKAYSLTGDIQNALNAMNKIVTDYPKSRHIDEVQFRRGEIFFVWQNYQQAEDAYKNIVLKHTQSPFYEKALYKLGWSQFKQSHYMKALETYVSLLDIKEKEEKINQYGIKNSVSKSEKDFIIDSLRVTSLSLSYLDGYKSIESLFSQKKNKIYEPLIYQQLGQLYTNKARYEDAANTYMEFTKKHPNNILSPDFHNLALQAYIDGGIKHKILNSKITYVKHYGINTLFWKQQKPADQNKIRPYLVQHIRDIGQHFHALARKSKKTTDFRVAANWYQKYLIFFPKNQDSPYINFLLAESYYDARLYSAALTEYEKSAYQYPTHSKSAEAAYAALLTYNILIKSAKPIDKEKLKQQELASSIRFSNSFPTNKHAAAVTTKTAEKLLQVNNYQLASEFSKRIIDNKKIKKTDLRRTAWIVYAHAQFELKQYALAENAYKTAIRYFPKQQKNKQLIAQLTDKLAASIYKQAELFKAKNENKTAAYHFLRIRQAAPASSIRATAEYDAATLYIQMKNWKTAIKILENFRRSFPKHKKYKQGISSKLALSYTQTKKFDKAAKEIAILSKYAKTPEDRQQLLWDAAEMYDKANHKNKAINLYQQYIKKYKHPFNQMIEAYYRITKHYKNNYKQRIKWLKKLIAAEKKGGKQRNDRSKYLAASAAFELAQPTIKRFKQVKLNIPLKKNLRIKKSRMKAAVKAYKTVLSYNIAEFSTASTYHMGEIYNHLAQSLMDSQRPKNLSSDELEQYDILLEEQAYPFEEKSISIHSANIKRTKQGIYDKWIKKSMNVLAKIQPVRYAKQERIEPYVLTTH